MYKPPGVAESIDWSQALHRLGVKKLDSEIVNASIGTVLKYREDQDRIRTYGIDDILAASIASD